ncbi:MAG: XisI protein [Merismopedia sp. SIO2A8]|nr:XisI protein [Merismopedia sp. SIO2A8]
MQYDGSEIAIADQLAEREIPKQSIVLTYQAPIMRAYSEFAVG